MTHHEIREKFIDFFEKRGHKIVPSSSLLPDDPSVLFTTAGMQQFKRYYTNPEMAPAKNVASIQKSMRTSDIDAVGDESHLTFFEMLGNFSFGGYWKEEAIKIAHEFVTEELGLKIGHVSVFQGDEKIPADEESKDIWQRINPNLEIKGGNREDNFWGPTGSQGPCGPTTEIYVEGLEIWNIVFNEFYCTVEKEFKLLETKGVDTGMGLERLAMVVQGKKNIFETDLFDPIFKKIENQTLTERKKRIIADHARAVVFLISDGVRPSNKERGYVLRRLMRRIIAYVYQENIQNSPEEIFRTIVKEYNPYYKNLDFEVVKEVYDSEYGKFVKSLGAGLKELERLESIDRKAAFRLYESFGLPYEIIKESAGLKAEGLNRDDFEEEFRKHQEISRTGAIEKFKP